MRQAMVVVLLGLTLGAAAAENEPASRPRARELGIAPGVFAPGPLNTITDVPGVRVGHFTLIEGDDIRTGATAIVPHAGNLFQEKVPAAIVVGNGFGKLVGSTQVDELGQLETPILLTNTLNVWEAAAALADHTLGQPGNQEVRSVNPVVGETNDGWLNDIRRRPLRKEHFLQALEAAAGGPVEEGSVGAGTGTTAFGFKGGIGTASRQLSGAGETYTVGVLVQTNYGGELTIDGVPVGEKLGPTVSRSPAVDHAGSCMIVVATDGPLDARQLRRLAFRALAGMARTGASFSHGSGDYVIAFSTAESVRIPHRSASATLTSTLLREDKLSPLFQAVAEATEEAIYNSLLQATTVRGHQGHEAQAIPVEDVKRLLKEHGRSARLMPNRPCRSRQLVLAKKVMWLPDSCGCIETQGNGTRGIGKVSVLTCVGCIRPAKQRLASELSAEFVRPEADLVSYDQLRGKGSRSHPQTRAKNRFFNDPPLCSTGRFQHPASVNPRAGRSIDELNGCSCKKAEREEKHNLQEPVQLGPCVSPPLHRCRFLEKDKDRSADHGDAYERQYVVHRRAPPLKPVAQ